MTRKRSPFIDLVPDPLTGGLKVLKGSVGTSMDMGGRPDPLRKLGVISLPKHNPEHWMPSQVEEQLTEEETTAIYEKIKNLGSVPEKEIHIALPGKG